MTGAYYHGYIGPSPSNGVRVCLMKEGEVQMNSRIMNRSRQRYLGLGRLRLKRAAWWLQGGFNLWPEKTRHGVISCSSREALKFFERAQPGV